MTTITDLAREFNTTPYELRAFADDMLDGLADTDEIPADTEAVLREAHAEVEENPGDAVSREYAQEEHAHQTLLEIEQESGWLESSTLPIDEGR
jgi:hypothetical protein